MFKRLLNLSDQSSFFLFGPRGSGKTHLLKDRFPAGLMLYIDLLDPETQQTLSLRPSSLVERLDALPRAVKWIVIDEIQKIPVLLDVVHQQIERKRFKFALTGSSARKLKHGGANLLAGRAFVHHLFPLTAAEIGSNFSLLSALRWGTLPRLFSLKSDEDKRDFLRSYTHAYFQEEIIQEQVVRKLDPFRRFLLVAAQMNGQIVNFAKIAREAGTTVPTVQSYFQILEDTLVGFLLDSFHESIRKRQRENPKFYFFDTGVARALGNRLSVELTPRTYEFGATFEHFLINEIQRLQSYKKKDYRFSYLRTKESVEVDLIIERPGLKRALVEIKSAERVGPEDVRAVASLAPDIPNSEAFCLSLDPIPKVIAGVRCLPWRQGLEELGLS
ncbi:MAG: ATP-binding protein [Elusimicrobia bacterium]|nr:ATP-binding protein [Elusimicrobiota bacterium]